MPADQFALAAGFADTERCPAFCNEGDIRMSRCLAAVSAKAKPISTHGRHSQLITIVSTKLVEPRKLVSNGICMMVVMARMITTLVAANLRLSATSCDPRPLAAIITFLIQFVIMVQSGPQLGC